MTKPIYVLSGPNLNLLGSREPEIYGHETLEMIHARCAERAAPMGMSVVCRQTNHEGVLIDWVQEARSEACALVINPAGFGHTSIALLDALKVLAIPIIECHLSNPSARESFRRKTYVSLAAAGVISGFGGASYELAIEAAQRLISPQSPERSQ
jgi:3-dehydroquinate dehydratase-2